jgi:CspA family cold shock protein
MNEGTVKWYDPGKGYGFVAREDGGADVFVHRSAVGFEPLAEGDRIAFEVVVDGRGERAEGVQVLERSGIAPRPRPVAASGWSPDGGRDRGGSGYGAGNGYGSGNGGGYGGRFGNGNGGGGATGSGVVRRWDATRGFGFIRPEGFGDDLFFHQSAVRGMPVREGDRVDFVAGQGPKGPRADEVRLVGEGA